MLELASKVDLKMTDDMLPRIMTRVTPRTARPASAGVDRLPLARRQRDAAAVGLRPTRQRMALGWLLFGKGARHLTAEMLYEEATLAKVPVSLATVYNTLNQLTDAGLLRQVSVDGTKTYFDTNVTAHHHFYLENNHELVDIPDPHLVLSKMPDVPEGYEIARVDMVVRLRKKR